MSVAKAGAVQPVAASGRARSDRLWAVLFILPQAIGLVAFALVPLVFSFVLGFMTWDGLGDKAWAGLANFQKQLVDPEFLAALRNTIVFTVLTVPVGLVLALLVALGVNKIRGRMVYRALYFAPVVTSSVAVAMVWQYLLNGRFGLINAWLRRFGMDPPDWLLDTRFVLPAIALVTIWWTLGLNVVIFLAGLQNVPVPVQEAARIDGANNWRVFRDVTLPILSPTIFFSVVIAIISSLQTFDQIFVLTNGGPLDASRTLVFHIYDLAFRKFSFGESSAVALILFVLTLGVTLVQFWGQRRWVHYD